MFQEGEEWKTPQLSKNDAALITYQGLLKGAARAVLLPVTRGATRIPESAVDMVSVVLDREIQRLGNIPYRTRNAYASLQKLLAAIKGADENLTGDAREAFVAANTQARTCGVYSYSVMNERCGTSSCLPGRVEARVELEQMLAKSPAAQLIKDSVANYLDVCYKCPFIP